MNYLAAHREAPGTHLLLHPTGQAAQGIPRDESRTKTRRTTTGRTLFARAIILLETMAIRVTVMEMAVVMIRRATVAMGGHDRRPFI